MIGLILCQTIHTGYVVATNYRLYAFMSVRFNWDVDMIPTYDSIFGSATLPGAAIGSFLGSKLLRKGRRSVLYLTTVIATVAISILMVENMWVILAGRILMGFSMGFLSISTGRFLEEFTPSHLYGPVMTL